ncbi:CoA-transferase subunit beta [Phytohabitans kaempferiae]|uniref:CoA-transferase subunit beta n=1 Tax=Phytohabitans kaempferiae TaxID=1620943 RepID=A0ABV6M5T2_9ACTN
MTAAADYTVDELMVAVLAACFDNDDQVCNGLSSFIPVCAIQLARMTHAPDLVWIAGAAGVDPGEVELTASTFEAPLWRDSVMYLEHYAEFWDYAASDRFLLKFCAGAAQIDAYGNTNNSVIGRWDRPKVRLPGTAGLGDMGSLGKQLIFWVTDHSTRTLVERVDFRSGIGYLNGGGERARLGLRGGPSLVVTNLAVFDFEPGSERMRLASVHEGVGVDDVLAATGFTPVVPADVPRTPAPTAEQVRLIRDEIDPTGFRKRGFRSGQARGGA